MESIVQLLLSLDGRIGRAKFWLGILILVAVNVVATYVILALVGLSHAALMFSVAVSFALAYPYYALMAKRFQDRDKPGALALIGLVPMYPINLLHTFEIIDPTEPSMLVQILDVIVIGIFLWFLVELGLLKGTQGPNRYGPDPLGQIHADAGL